MKTEKQELLHFYCSNYLEFKKEQCEESSFFAKFSDEDLVRCAKQNKECFGCIVKRYEYKMKNYVKRVAGASLESTEDIVQEVFLKVYLNLDRFDESMKFSSWIYRIAHNQAVNKYLYEKRRKTECLFNQESGEISFAIRDEKDFWHELQQKSINNELKKVLKTIPEKYQKVIELSYFSDNSYQEIAKKTARPVNTVGTMLSRAKKILKAKLQQAGISCDVALVQMEKRLGFGN